MPDKDAKRFPWSEAVSEGFGNLFHDVITVNSAGETTLVIEAAPVKSGLMQKLTRIRVINETSNYTRLRIGAQVGPTFHLYEEQLAPDVDKLYWTDNDIFLGESNKLRFELTGTTNLDRISIFIEGFEAKVSQ